MPSISTADPSGASRGKPLQSVSYSPEYGALVVTTNHEVPHGTQPAFSTWTLNASVVNERNQQKSRAETIELSFVNGSPQVYPQTQVQCGGVAELASFACCLKTVTNIVNAASAIVEPVFGEVEKTWQRVSPTVAIVKTTLPVTESFISKVDYATDDEATRIRATRSVVAANTVPPANDATHFYSQQQLDCAHAVQTVEEVLSAGSITYSEEDPEFCLHVQVLQEDVSSGTFALEVGKQKQITPKKQRFVRVTKTLQNWDSWQRETYRTIDFSFPSVLEGFTTSATFVPQHRRTEFNLNLNIKEGYSGQIDARVVETLVATVPGSGDKETIFSPQPRPLVYDGVLFQLNTPALLFNLVSLSANTNSNDTYYGLVTDTFEKPATSPSASEYSALVNSEVCIQDVCEPTRYCLFKRTRIFIKVK